MLQVCTKSPKAQLPCRHPWLTRPLARRAALLQGMEQRLLGQCSHTCIRASRAQERQGQQGALRTGGARLRSPRSWRQHGSVGKHRQGQTDWAPVLAPPPSSSAAWSSDLTSLSPCPPMYDWENNGINNKRKDAPESTDLHPCKRWCLVHLVVAGLWVSHLPQFTHLPSQEVCCCGFVLVLYYCIFKNHPKLSNLKELYAENTPTSPVLSPYYVASHFTSGHQL